MTRGMSLRHVTNAAGLSPACVSNVENGKSPGSPKSWAALEKALDMEPGALDRNRRH